MGMLLLTFHSDIHIDASQLRGQTQSSVGKRIPGLACYENQLASLACIKDLSAKTCQAAKHLPSVYPYFELYKDQHSEAKSIEYKAIHKITQKMAKNINKNHPSYSNILKIDGKEWIYYIYPCNNNQIGRIESDKERTGSTQKTTLIVAYLFPVYPQQDK